jgi:hypothetical protein
MSELSGHDEEMEWPALALEWPSAVLGLSAGRVEQWQLLLGLTSAPWEPVLQRQDLAGLAKAWQGFGIFLSSTQITLDCHHRSASLRLNPSQHTWTWEQALQVTLQKCSLFQWDLERREEVHNA